MDQLIRLALETFPNFVITDRAGCIMYINKAYAQLLGYDCASILGRLVEDVIPNTRLMRVMETGQEEFNSVMKLYDHTTQADHYVVCNRIPIFDHGQVIGVVAATTALNLDDITKLNEAIAQIKAKRQSLLDEMNALRDQRTPLCHIIGTSRQTLEAKQIVEEYADSNLSFLITGETGVGKEVFARAIHQMSTRADAPYVKINCAAIPANLLESELFGYAEGAFSGAAKGGKIGKFELANRGTILLDEIGDLPLELQAKLLRVIQEQEVERVGSVNPLKINVRIICCTNQNLEQLVEDGTFRSDLFYRINAVELFISPLRARLDDLDELCYFFISRFNREYGYSITGISDDALALLTRHDWPGNVRELEHVMERASVAAKRGELDSTHFGFLQKKAVSSEPAQPKTSLISKTAQLERDMLLGALAQAKGNKSKAAALLQVNRTWLYRKLQKYGIA